MACNMNNNMGNSPINSRGCLNSRCGNTRNMNCNMNTMHNGTGCGMNRSFNAGNRQMPPSHRDSDNFTHECGCKRNEGCDRGNEPVDSMVICSVADLEKYLLYRRRTGKRHHF